MTTTPPERIVADGVGRLPVFSHASIAGELIFVSGTLGTLPGSFDLAPGGTGPETTQTLRNIETILAEAGADLSDVVKASVYLADMTTFRHMNEAWSGFFAEAPPARITVGGAVLALGAAVEIECVAQRPHRPPAKAEGEPLPRSTGFAERDGERIYWESVGEGEPLVLCHGAGGNHAVWYQQVPVFGRHRRVITWDHRGFGRSTDRAAESGPAAAVGDLEALLCALGVEACDLVGQSMGGWTALSYALRHPERVRSLTLADTPGGISSPELASLVESLRSGAAPLAPPDRLGLHPALHASFAGRDPAGAYLYQMLGGFGEPDLARIAPRLLGTTVSEEELAGLRCPVLFLVGEHDALFPPALIRAAGSQVKGARVVELPGAGHSPYFETPDAWNRALAGFLGVGL